MHKVSAQSDAVISSRFTGLNILRLCLRCFSAHDTAMRIDRILLEILHCSRFFNDRIYQEAA